LLGGASDIGQLHLPSPFGDKDMIQKLKACNFRLIGRITTLLTQAAEPSASTAMSLKPVKRGLLW